MTPEEFQKYYPLLLGWIDVTLRAHARNTRTVTSRGLPRLALYFSAYADLQARADGFSRTGYSKHFRTN